MRVGAIMRVPISCRRHYAPGRRGVLHAGETAGYIRNRCRRVKTVDLINSLYFN